MKTTRGSTSLDKKLAGQYRQLFRNLGLLMLAIAALAIGAVIYFDKRQVGDLSRKLISSTATTVVAQLASFFKTEDGNLRIAVEQLQMARVEDDELLDKLLSHLFPFISQDQNASGILFTEVADNADYFGIMKLKPRESEFLVRIKSAQHYDPELARLERWKDGKMVESWFRKDDFDPRTRPWYKKTLAAETNEIVATDPYQFYDSRKPGITIASHWYNRFSGRHFILAVDILLSNITRFTQAMRPTQNGVVFVFTQDLHIVGLPADERFSDQKMIDAVLFKPLDMIDLPLLEAGVAEWEKHGRIRQSFPFTFDGENWWAGFEWIEDHPNHAGLWTGILVPESDFLGALSLQRNFSMAAIVGLGLLLGLILVLNTIRKMRYEVRQAVSHIGQRLGPFEILHKIGDGGYGTVYRASHALLKRPTAVKVMLPQFAASEAAKQRFHKEVQITSSLTHPNTVAVFDFGQTPEGTLYYAMEHLDGVTLDDLVRIAGPQPAARVLRILYQICGSLREAHGRGLIHRDIKPANVMLCERGGLYDVVKVLDFGLVKDLQDDEPNMTQAEAMVGTPFYLAPELINDASAFSPASDLYALGGVAYFLLTGSNVFEGASAAEICDMHLHQDPVPPSRRSKQEIPVDLEAAVMSCLAKQPRRRPPNAGAMSEMLVQCKDFGVWTSRQAAKWWLDNRSALPMETHERSHSPLADTQTLMDTGNGGRT